MNGLSSRTVFAAGKAISDIFLFSVRFPGIVRRACAIYSEKLLTVVVGDFLPGLLRRFAVRAIHVPGSKFKVKDRARPLAPDLPVGIGSITD